MLPSPHTRTCVTRRKYNYPSKFSTLALSLSFCNIEAELNPTVQIDIVLYAFNLLGTVRTEYG